MAISREAQSTKPRRFEVLRGDALKDKVVLVLPFFSREMQPSRVAPEFEMEPLRHVGSHVTTSLEKYLGID